MEMTRSLLKAMKVPNYMWGEAVRHATYIINRVPTRALKNQTPYECLKNRKPSIAHLKIFGCIAHTKIDSGQLRKLDDRSMKLVHLGIEPGTKAYRLYNPTTRRIIVSRDVVFNEKESWNWKGAETEEIKESGMFRMTWGDAMDNGYGPYLISTHQEEDVAAGVEAQTSQDSATVNTNTDQTEPQLPRRSTRQVSCPSHLEDYILLADLECEILLLSLDDELRNYQEAKKLVQWTNADRDEIDSINKNRTWDLVDKPSGVKIIGLKWVFKVKRNADGTINKFKASLVAKGYVQEHGVDYDEVFAPVARLETIRLLIGMAAIKGCEIHHLDVKTAFLHGELTKDVYVSQPEGFEKKGEEHKVFKLSKALYCLKQASRAWNTRLNKILIDMKFMKFSKESSVSKEGRRQASHCCYLCRRPVCNRKLDENHHGVQERNGK